MDQYVYYVNLIIYALNYYPHSVPEAYIDMECYDVLVCRASTELRA